MPGTYKVLHKYYLRLLLLLTLIRLFQAIRRRLWTFLVMPGLENELGWGSILEEDLRDSYWEQLGKAGSDQESFRHYPETGEYGQGSGASLPGMSYLTFLFLSFLICEMIVIITQLTLKQHGSNCRGPLMLGFISLNTYYGTAWSADVWTSRYRTTDMEEPQTQRAVNYPQTLNYTQTCSCGRWGDQHL